MKSINFNKNIGDVKFYAGEKKGRVELKVI